MKDLEHKAQVAVIKWATLARGEFPELELLFAIPNGGARNIVTATRLKDSPAWLPQARTPAVFRFFNAGDRSELAAPDWGPVKIAYLREQAHEALKKPTAMNQWLRYHCNVKTASSEKAIRPGLWTENAGELRPLENRVSYGGFDLGRANDWAAIALVFPVRDWNEHKEADETTYDLIAHCFSCQEGAIDWRREPYSEWRRSGLVTVSQGNQVDFGAVERKIIEWTRLYSTQTWDYDPTFAGQMGQRLLNNFGIQVHMMYQTCRNYNEPIRHMLSKLELQSVRHGGDPVLAWQAGNLTIRRNTQDEWMPDKGATTAKIDAMVAALMAFSGAIYGEGASNYEDRGFRTL